MKRITILSLIAMIGLMGCSYTSIDNTKPVIVKETGVSNLPNRVNNLCYYITRDGEFSSIYQLFCYNSCFYDTCGKYKVGDTIKLTK